MSKSKFNQLTGFLTKNRLRAILIIAILLAGSVLIVSQLTKEEPATDNSTDAAARPDSYINLDPPTETDKKEAEDHKQSLAEEQDTSTPATQSGKKAINPVITSVSSDGAIRSYVPGVIEDGGVCTATATRSGSPTATGTSIGFADASYTGCPPITLDIPGSGWLVVVSYSSTTAEGESTPYP